MNLLCRADCASALAVGIALDGVLADPQRGHPVAGFGMLASLLESVLLPSTSVSAQRARGVAFTTILVGGIGVASAVVTRLTADRPLARVIVGAATYWSCAGGTSLLRVAHRIADRLDRGDLDGARRLLPWLCGRDPHTLDAEALARAVVESVAENTSDAAVATIVWGALAGPGGAAAHRAANTLDAMVGHHSDRYERFGWASARLDDVMGWPAARLTGILMVALAPTVGGKAGAALEAWHRDAPTHPSPNAGVVEASCAGALGVELGGATPYPYGVDHRPLLGTGRTPTPADIRRATTLSRRVQIASTLLAVLTMVAVTPGRFGGRSAPV